VVEIHGSIVVVMVVGGSWWWWWLWSYIF